MAKTNLVTIKVNGVEIKCTQEQAIAIVSACGNSETKTQKKGKEAPQKEKKQKFETRKEAIDDWCQKKGYSEADRKAYGAQKRSERELQKKAYEMTNAQFTEKVAHKVWMAAYKVNLAALSK